MSAYAIIALVVLTLFIPVASFTVAIIIANSSLSDDASLALVAFVMGCSITLGHLVYIL